MLFRTHRGFGILAAALLCTALHAQEYRGTLNGTVSDQTGASVPGATVTVLNPETGISSTAQTNTSGSYVIPFVVPGTYTITVSASGFKQALRDNIEVHAGDKIRVDMKLELGAATERITVSAEAELVSSSGTLGQTMNTEQVKDLPILGRNPFLLAALTTGVSSALYTQKVSQNGRPFDGATVFMSMGGYSGQYQVLLNGIPNAPPERASGATYTGYVPSPEAVEEVTVQTNLYDAQYGHTSGALINTVLKGGTNKLHGTAYEFFRNDKLNASTFEANYSNSPRPIMRWNQPGFAIGGPVLIPKIYNGRDKTFFIVSFEIIRNSNPTPFIGTVPTDLQRRGDFSQTFQTNGSPILIYDPLTTKLVNGQYVRDPFPGNVIPAERINPVGAALMSYYPKPNLPGNVAGFNNYLNTPNSQSDKYSALSVRMDHDINSSNRLMGTVVRNVRNQTLGTAGFPDVASPGYLHFRNNYGASLDWISTLSPTTMLDVKYGVIYHPFQVAYFGDNFDLTKLGLPTSLISQLPRETFPGTNLSNGYSGLQNAGSQFSTTVTQSLSGTVTKTISSHTVKTGAEWYSMRANNMVPASNLGAFNFTSGFTQQNALNASASAGNPIASMLLGYPSGGAVNINIASAYQQLYYGVFVHDDWHVNRRLTLNLGLRWDYEGPMSERYDRQNAGFAFNATNPLQASVQGLTLKGGLLFTDSSNRLPFVRDLNNWQPRFGAAFRIDDKTVLRGGFGVMYPITFNTGDNKGFSVTTDLVASTDGNLTPAGTLSNPFPGGVNQPVGRSRGLSTLVGQNISFSDPTRTIPRILQYSFGLQRQLPLRTVLDVAYVGSSGSQLPVNPGRNTNALPAEDFALGSAALLAPKPNPMAGLIPGSALNSATTPYQNLLVPYPEFGSITENFIPVGKRLYNSLQASASKRFSGGLQARASFTWSKIMDSISYLNPQVVDLTRVQGSEPSRLLNLAITYELPFFKDSHGLTRQVLGGWEFNAIFRYSNGDLIAAPSSNAANVQAFSTGVNPKLANPTYTHWFNTCSLNSAGVRQNCISADEPVAFVQQPPFTLRTLSTVLPGVRREIPPTLDFSVFKIFRLRESTNLEFRANAFNLANTPEFGAPNTTFGSAIFGVVTLNQANDPRIVELALKLTF